MNKSEIIAAIESLTETSNQEYKIGIGITEHNRYDVFLKSYLEILKNLPPNANVIVVDDASTKPFAESTFRFEKNVGIAKAKNKCLELLYLMGCEHIFLFDSDTYPIHTDWWKPYVESSEPHLNYIFKDFAMGGKLNDTQEIYRDETKIAYSHVRGCMMYYHRSVLDAVGGMDPIFGKWGYEHPNLSDRIFMKGLTSFRYMDVVGSEKLIYSADEHRAVKTTVGGRERDACIAANKLVYQSKLFDSNYVQFIEKKNILLTSYLVNVVDPQRGNAWGFNLGDLEPLRKSLKDTNLVILSDNKDMLPYDTTGKVDWQLVDTNINPYIQRWISYREFLMKHRHEYENVFCIDATDVELLREPDWNNLGDNLWCGDEMELLNCDWMRNNHPSLSKFFSENADKQLLNAGVVGGSVENMIEFMRQIIDFYSLNTNVGKTDMGVFNYIARTNWDKKIRTGRQVCTVFKGDERNKVSWFKHK